MHQVQFPGLFTTLFITALHVLVLPQYKYKVDGQWRISLKEETVASDQVRQKPSQPPCALYKLGHQDSTLHCPAPYAASPSPCHSNGSLRRLCTCWQQVMMHCYVTFSIHAFMHACRAH